MLSLERSLKNKLISNKQSNKRTPLHLADKFEVQGGVDNFLYDNFENNQEQGEIVLNEHEESECNNMLEFNQEMYYYADDDLDSLAESEGSDLFNEGQLEIEAVLQNNTKNNIHGIKWDIMKNFDSFKFDDHLMSILEKKYKRDTPGNNQEPLYDGASITLKDFDTKLRSIIAHSGLSEKLTKDLKNLFIKSLPDDSKYKLEDNQDNISDKPVIFEFECCLCGNTVYEGELKGSNQCDKCNLNRYTDKSQRYPFATINYRPITTIICELLENESFLVALKVVNKDIKGDGIFSDINDSQYSKELKKDMHNNHVNKMKDKKFKDYNVIEVSLLLGFSYDGAQIYHKAITNFWPMFISILNLPPELRKTLGHGTFMIGLFTSVSGSVAEEFLLHKCLVEELLMLSEGIVLKIKNKVFHIQARLCIIGVDSKALETVTYTQGSNSYAGCPLCRLGTG